MHILLLNYEFPPLGGGAANATWHLLHELEFEEDISVDLITSSTAGAQMSHFSERIRIFYLDIGKKAGQAHYQTNRDLLRYTWAAWRKARRLIREQPYDLVHAFFGIPCGWIAKQLGIPYIVSLRGSDVPFYNPRFAFADAVLFRRLSRRIWQQAAAVVANSQGLKALAQQSAPRQAIQLIPNGVDTRYFHPDKGKKQPGPLHLLTVSRLIARKGIGDLLQALHGLNGIRLTIAGDGNLRHELEAQAQNLQLNVQFAGNRYRDELRIHYQQADAFVLPSHNEGMSNALLEAMASGLPVVVTDVGGSAELVSTNGYTVAVGDLRALRQAIIELRDHPTQLVSMGQDSRKKAETLNWGSMAKQYLALYQKFVAS